MRRICNNILGLIFFLSGATFAQAETIGKIVAIVNDDVITQQELDEALKDSPGIDHQKVLDRLIENRLILQKAKAIGIVVTPEELEGVIQNVKNRYPSQQAFEEALLDAGMSYKAFENRHKDQWVIRRLVSQEVRARCRVSPRELETYYQSHLDEFRGPEGWKLSHILIQKRMAGKEDPEAKKVAKHLLKRLRKGEDFKNLARLYSQGPRREEGGDLGVVERGKLTQEIETVLAPLPIGGISDLIETPLGYNIFRIEDRKDAILKELKDVKGKIHDHLLQGKIKTRYETWIAELKKDAYIKQ